MRSKRSLVQIYLLSLVALSAIPLAVLGYIWIAKEYERYNEQSATWRDSYIESRRELLRREVNKAAEYVDFRYSQLNTQIYNELRHQVAGALTLIESNAKQSGNQSRSDQLSRLVATFGSLRFRDNNGFFFLYDDKGKSLLAPMAPRRQERISDPTVLREIASQFADLGSDKNFHFVEYLIKAPSQPEQTERNFSFIYYYEPLKIYLGASIYLRDEIARVKQEVIERIAAVPIDTEHSVLFVVDEQGRQLVNAYEPEAVGQLMPQVTREAQRADGKDKSLYTELSWRARDGQQQPVVSYLRRFEPWGWVMGSGVFLNELNQQLAAERLALQQRVNEHVRFIVLIAFGLMVLSTIVARWLALRSASGFRIFQQFFNDASKRSTAIDINRLPFAEFQHLAENANFMVAKRSETERALKLSERRFALALDAAHNHLWDLDLSTGLVTVSDSFYRMLGYPPPKKPVAVGSYREIANDDDIEIIAAAVDSWLGLATGNSVEFRVRDVKGRYRWIYSRGDVVESDDADRPIRAMGIMIDITDRKRIEQELVDARIAAEDALHAKSQFLSSVSHELRTPLNGVLGYAQLLQREVGMADVETAEHLRGIESCGKHLLNLINDVLDLAKIESGNINIVTRANTLKDVLGSVSDIVAHRARSKGLEFHVDIATNVPRVVEVDEVKLRQVLVNLLDNAVKFTNAGRVALNVTVDSDDGALKFAVTDTGVGIPVSKLRDVFEPFKQVNPQDGKGTGLGLSICRRLVEAMGGSISLSSVEGQGSCFYFEIPLVVVEEELPADFGPVSDAPPLVKPVVRGDMAIIVVDDVAVNRQVLLGMLSDISADIREAADGQEVLDLLEERPADLVLMDLRMPRMDGMEATRIIKQERKMDNVFVVMASATTDEDVVAEAYAAGCGGFLAKPIGMEELYQVVATVSGDSDGGVVTDNIVDLTPAPRSVVDVAVSPPEGILSAMAEAAELGDISALRENIHSLRVQHPECEGFSREADRLLAEFDFEGLSTLCEAMGEGVGADGL